jgi:hypothetical protein
MPPLGKWTPSPEGIAARLAAPKLAEALAPFWEAALLARPQGPLSWLASDAITRGREALGVPPECDEALQSVARFVREDRDLEAIAWYLHWRLFLSPHPGAPDSPDLGEKYRKIAGPFFLLIALGLEPALRIVHHGRGYPGEVTEDALVQVKGYVENFRKGTGEIGCYGAQVCWLRTYIEEPYVRLGRIAFQLMRYSDIAQVWQRRRDGAFLALARAGLPIEVSGLIAEEGTPSAWCTHRNDSLNAAEGHPIDPSGRILPSVVRLERKEWEPFLSEGDWILSMHIPPGGAMTLEAIEDSLERAQAFFPRYHGDRPPRAFWCATWFLDPRLADLLPPTANPVRLQRCVYLHPIRPEPGGGLWFVFLRSLEDISRLPRDTSLQRVLADFLATGGRWHGGGGFFSFSAGERLDENRFNLAFKKCLEELGSS